MSKRLRYLWLCCLLFLWTKGVLAFVFDAGEHRLWRITAPDGVVRGYLFGTVHLPVWEEKLLSSFPHLEAVLAEVQAVAVENPSVVGEPLSPDENIPFDCERGLTEYLSAKELKAAQIWLEKHYGKTSLLAQYVACLKPDTLFQLQLRGALPDRETNEQGVQFAIDTVIAVYALRHSKTLYVLEKDEVYERTKSYSHKFQRLMLIDWLSRMQRLNNTLGICLSAEGKAYFWRHVLNCYLNEPECYSKEPFPGYQKNKDWVGLYIEQRANEYDVIYRNYCWMDKVSEYLKKKITLFAVGIDHLTGSENLIELLTAQGYQVEPVALPFQHSF